MKDFSPLNIAVLSGGISHERDISLQSGQCVADALIKVGHQVTLCEPDSVFLSLLTDNPPDVVWPALHGASGEDGGLRALLELNKIPFVGSSSSASRLAWSKPVAKTLIERTGIETPHSLTLAKETFRELGASHVLNIVVNEIGLPLVVKPSEGGSAQGVSIVSEAADLARAMVSAYTYSDVTMIEKYIEGTEVSVSIIDRGDGDDLQVLPIIEIEPIGGVYSFEARYNAGKTFFYNPPRLNEPVVQQIRDAALQTFSTLGLRHISRIDFIVSDNKPWFLEANVAPGLTETSLLPQSINAAGSTLGATYSGLAIAAFTNSQ